MGRVWCKPHPRAHGVKAIVHHVVAVGVCLEIAGDNIAILPPANHISGFREKIVGDPICTETVGEVQPHAVCS
jgi:hypothetical protein